MARFCMIILSLVVLGGCGKVLEGNSWFVLGTRLAVRVVPVSGRDTTGDLNALHNMAVTLERQYDPGRTASAVCVINRKGRIDRDAFLYPVLVRGLSLAKRTDGAFDPFLLPLTRLWGFSTPHPVSRPPAADMIRKALAASGYGKVRTGPGGLLLPSGGGFDGGGYVKGLAADRIAARLREWGYRQAIVDAGGDIALIGRRPESFGPENGWIVMIAHPDRRGRNWCSLIIRDRAVVTSGDYERYFTWKGRRYHHILDPRSGYPAPGTASVTVVGPSVETADALATAFFVSGYRKALRILSRFPGYGFMMLRRRGGRLDVKFSPGFRARWKYRREP